MPGGFLAFFSDHHEIAFPFTKQSRRLQLMYKRPGRHGGTVSPAVTETNKSGHGEGHSFMVIFKCT